MAEAVPEDDLEWLNKVAGKFKLSVTRGTYHLELHFLGLSADRLGQGR